MTADNKTAVEKAKDLIEKFGEALALDVAQELFNETDWTEAPFWDDVKKEIVKQQEFCTIQQAFDNIEQAREFINIIEQVKHELNKSE